MKRIGILSDTHSHFDPRWRHYLEPCDEIWHAGDIGDIDTLRALETIGPRVRAVCGNVDHGMVRRICPEIIIDTVEGVRFMLTHIGGYPGRWRPGMKQLLRDEHINLMVCGHSHILKVMPDAELGLLHVNPGAAGLQGWQRERTLVCLTLDAGTIKDLDVITLTH